MTQNEQILSHLQKGLTIDPIQALRLFGCFRLASRINELKDKGYIIDKEMRENLDTGARWAEYFLITDEVVNG